MGLTLAGLWGLLLLEEEGGQLIRPRTGLAAAWSLGVLLLALTLSTGSWSALLGAPGLGAEIPRVLLGAALLLLLPWLAGRPGSGHRTRSLTWAVGTGAASLLVLPQLRLSPFYLALAVWWLLQLLAPLWSGALQGALARLWRRGTPTAAATLNGP